MTTGKRAYAAEVREKKILEYTHKIKALIARVNINPFEIDYSEELEKLHKQNPKDKTLIITAERQAYEELRK
jgi:hypothetical protein